MSCRPDSSGADWFVCHRGTLGCPRVHDGITPHCRFCAVGTCTMGHEPIPVGMDVEMWCKRHPEDRGRLIGKES